MRPYFLSLVVTGTIQSPTFFIQNAYGEYWSEDGWVMQQADALSYRQRFQVLAEMQRLLREQFKAKPIRQFFTAPVFVEVLADKPVDISDVQVWVCDSSRLLLDPNVPFNGDGDPIGLTEIDWNQIRSIER